MDSRTNMRRLACLLLIAGTTAPLWAQNAPSPASAPTPDTQPVAASASFLVSSIQIHFIRDNPANPAAYSLMTVPVALMPAGDAYAPDDGSGRGLQITLGEFASKGNVRLTETGLAALAPALLRRLKDMGYVGVYVTPDPSQFRVENGHVVDTRAAGDTSLTLLVTMGQVTNVQTSAIGDRFDPDEDQLINNPLHQWIRDQSPVQPTGKGPPGSDTINEDTLADYTFRLNRQPGRRVDASVATPGQTPGDVQLNYVVTENRPWLLFAQVSNTGSASTSHWREHFGFVHNNLTNDDDIATVDYQTANFSEVHSIAASYERPFVEPLDRLRWKIDGSWYSYRASDLGQQLVNFRGEGWDVGAHLIWNFYQHRDWFVDLLAGVRYKNIRVSNDAAFVSGHNAFFEPDVALRLERHREDTRTDVLLTAIFNIPGVGTDASTIDALGRSNADNDFTILRLDASHSFYLDPLFRPEGAPVGGLVHELAFQFHGQESFGARLIPNEEDIAGGLYTVRGYPQAIVAGDDVIIASAEYRFHLPRLLDPQPDPDTFFGYPWRWRPQYELGPTDWDFVLKGFVDAARVLNSSRESFETNTTLIGAGVGAELSLSRRVSLRADFGIALKPVNDANGVSIVDNGHTELHFVATFVY